MPAPHRTAAALAALSALPAMIALRGFTVDDAWIPARYAAHLASSIGYRFNPVGPPTDGVTPLPWAPLLAIVGGWAGVDAAWWAARAISALAWLAACALLGRAVALTPGSPARYLALLPLPLSAPLAAWSVAGLETGLVTLLAAAAVAAPPALACAAAGLAASLRPEMIVFASVIALASAASGAPRLRSALLALGPWLAVVALRLLFFSSPVPLSAVAKASDGHHGLIYVAAGLLLAGASALGLPLPYRLPSPRGPWAWPLAAALAHAAAVAWAGGDWMPLSRLLVPSFPAWIIAAARIAAGAPPWLTAARAALASAAMLFAWSKTGAAASSVVPTRASLIAQARPALAPHRAVVALDIGWVGAACDASIIDLAGLTDPAIASLPGGHTSKRVAASMLDARGADAALLLRGAATTDDPGRADGGPFARAVEERLAHDPWFSARFRPQLELRSGPLVYVLLVRVAP